LAIAALQAKKFPLAILTLEAMLQEMPEGTPAAQKIPLIEALLSASDQAQDLSKLVTWARIYFKLEGGNPSIRPVFIQSLVKLNRHEEVIQEVKEKIRLDEASKVKISVSGRSRTKRAITARSKCCSKTTPAKPTGQKQLPVWDAKLILICASN
jgi:hypothetical protein